MGAESSRPRVRVLGGDADGCARILTLERVGIRGGKGAGPRIHVGAAWSLYRRAPRQHAHLAQVSVTKPRRPSRSRRTSSALVYGANPTRSAWVSSRPSRIDAWCA